MNKLLKLTILLVLFLSINSFVIAQESEISEKKRKLITELIELTETNSQIVEITDKILASMQNTYPIIVKQMMERENQLSDEQKAKLSKEINLSYQSYMKKFRERLPIEIDYEQFIKDSVYPLYDKFFTEKELADLNAFYKTETGKKVVKTLPKLFAESTKLSEKLLVPKLLDLANKILKEEVEVLEEKLTKDVGK